MDLFDIVFYAFAAVTVISAFIVVFSRNVMYAACSLLFTFVGVAALYVLLQADFLAVTQILIYVGGILVLLLFGIMLTNNVVSVDIRTGAIHTVPAMILAAIVFGSLAAVFYATWSQVPAPVSTATTTTKALGELLMTRFVLPFEAASVVLVAALIGAAFLARRTRKQ